MTERASHDGIGNLSGLRFLIAGCGSIGKRHLKNLWNLGARDVVVFDPLKERRREVQACYDLESVSTYEAGLECDPNVVLICSPNRFHLEHAKQGVDCGCHLFIEKPLSHSLEGIPALIRETENKNLTALVACNVRFLRGLRYVKQACEQGDVGRPLFLRVQVGSYLPDWHPDEDYRQSYSANSSLGGGILLDAVHEIDYAAWMMGRAREVSCFADKLSRLEIDTEDTAALLLRYESGAMGEIHLDYVQRAYSRSCELVGEEGTLLWSFQDDTVSHYRAADRRWHIRKRERPYDVNEMYVNEMRHFLECIAGNESPEQDLAHAAHVLQIVEAAKESSQTGRTQILPE